MKCEYCDNPVPNGVTRCPSCGAAIHSYENPKDDSAPHVVPTHQSGGSMESSEQSQPSSSTYNPYLFVDKKSRVVYIVLALVFGEIGVHNFYAGFIGRGIAQLLITVLSFGLLFWISWIWAIIEICAVDHDGRGIPFD